MRKRERIREKDEERKLSVGERERGVIILGKWSTENTENQICLSQRPEEFICRNK